MIDFIAQYYCILTTSLNKILGSFFGFYFTLGHKQRVAMEQDTNGNIITDQANRIWMVGLGIVCLSIVAYGYMYSKNTTDNIAFLFGENLVTGFFIWGIFHTVLGRKQSKTKATVSFFFILGSLMASSLIGYSQHKLAATQAITEVQKNYSAITSSATDAQGLPQRIEKQLDTTPTTKGEFGEMERFIKIFMNQIASQRNDYLLEIDAIGWGKILNPERLEEDRTLIESKIMIQKAKDIVEKYRDRTYTLLENARKDISSLNVSESSKREMANGFDKGMVKSRAQIDKLWNLEAKTIAEFENIVTLLSARRGAWIVENGQILFTSDDDLSTFNSYVASIQDLVSEQEAIQKQNVQDVNNNFNKLKN